MAVQQVAEVVVVVVVLEAPVVLELQAGRQAMVVMVWPTPFQVYPLIMVAVVAVPAITAVMALVGWEAVEMGAQNQALLRLPQVAHPIPVVEGELIVVRALPGDPASS
jgi:hypothetical protein